MSQQGIKKTEIQVQNKMRQIKSLENRAKHIIQTEELNERKKKLEKSEQNLREL